MKKHRKSGSWQGRSARLVALGTLAVAAVGTAPEAHAARPKADQAQTATTTFDLAAGSLPSVLDAWKKASGVSLALHLSPETVAGFRSRGVHGAYSNEGALKQILDGTGLGYHFEHGGTRVEILILNAEQVSVTASTNSVALNGFTESLTDTAQTVNVVPQYILQEQAATSLKDSLRNVPGISMAAGEGGQQGDNLTIRGFSGRNDIYLDGIRDFGSYFRDSFDYETVDVIQGPASVEFGRGSTGGVVNQESKQAVSNRFFRPNVQFGTNGLRRGTFDGNLPLGNLIAHSAFRVNAMGMESGTAGRDIAQIRRWAVAPALSFGLGQATRGLVQYMHQFEDTTPDYGVTWLDTVVAPVPTNTFYGYRNFNRMRLTPDVVTGKVEHDFGSNFSLRNTLRYGRYPRTVRVTEAIVNSTGTITGVGTAINAPSLGQQRYLGSYNVFANYNSACAISTASVAASCYAQNTPASQVYLRRNNISRQAVDDILWNRAELTGHFSTHGVENSTAVLVEGGRERTTTGNSTYYQADGRTAFVSYAPLIHPNPDDATPPVTVANLPTHVVSQTYGFNVIDTLRATRWLAFSGGIRFDYFNTQSVGAPTTSAAGVVTPAVPVSRLDKKPTYRAAVIVKPSANGSVYFDYGTSFNPSAEGLSLSANNALLPPELNETYEAGIKWDLVHNKLNLNGSYFRTTKLNAKETDPLNSTNTILSGTQRVQGVQLGGLGHMPSHFDLVFGYAYLNSAVVSSILNISPFATTNVNFYNAYQERLKGYTARLANGTTVAIAPDATATIDPRYNTAPFFLSANGLPLTNVPKNSGNLWLTHALPWHMLGGFGGNYVAQRRSSSAAANALYTTQTPTALAAVPLTFRTVPGYLTLNAMVSRSLTDHLSVQANINNLTNKFYIDLPASNRLIPGERINAQFSLVGRF